jgi:hypothetical protein
MKKVRLVIAFALTLLSLTPALVQAQEFRASVAGQVTDASGSVLPGAAITARNVATNATYKTASGEDGEYVLRDLDPGSYTFSVEKTGFRKLLREGIVLQVGAQVTLNLQVQTGEVSEAITIREDIAQLQTETAVRGIVIDQTRVLNTPLQGRNMFAIAWSVPGVQIAASVTRLRPFDIAGSTSIIVNGGRRGQNDAQVDGVTATFQAGNISFVPSVDSVAEFKVITNPFDGQFGFTTGGVVTSVTRSGANQFHGGAFEFLQNTKLNANEFNSNRARIPRQRSNINTFGANLNGPVLRDKLFFAYSWEEIRQSIPDPFTTSIPTPLQRTGDFSQTRQLNHFPQFRFQDYEGLGSAPARVSPASTVYHFVTSVSKLLGDHSLKTGFEGRLFRNNPRDPGNANGVFNFNAGFTQQDPLAGASRTSGNPIASFLLGYPASGLIESRAFPARQHIAYAGFVQDDWRVTSKLKLNLGLRYELITGMTDRFDNLNVGFNPSAPLPVDVPGFTGKGNILYAGVGGAGRSAFQLDKNNLMPPFGLAYQWNDKTVIRGGVGQFYAPVWDDPGNFGFSQSTNLVTGIRVGLPDADIRDPFPTGLIAASRERSNTIGLGFNVFNPQRRIPNIWQYSVEVQRQLPWDMLFSLAGVGSSSRQIQVTQSINEIPASALAQGAAFLTAQVANPFAGKAPGTGLNGATVQRQQLLRPFPQFGSINVGGNAGGTAQYFGLQSSLQKRFAAGATFTLSHTWSKLMERINFQNPQDTELEKQIADADVTHNVGINGSYELPFGRGRKLFGSDNKIVNGIVGGWTLNGLVRLQSGMPTNFPANAEPVGSIDPIPSNQNIDQWYTPGSFRALAPITLRRFSQRYGSLRNPPIRNFDLSAFKTFGITETIKLQFRAELINAMNTPQWFNGPVTNPASGNFGSIGQGATS